jgi:hypothetical protein
MRFETNKDLQNELDAITLYCEVFNSSLGANQEKVRQMTWNICYTLKSKIISIASKRIQKKYLNFFKKSVIY